MERKCRNCGAMIESSDLKVCPYCDSEITFEGKVNQYSAASQDILDVSFELTLDGKDGAEVAVNNVQTIKNYAEKMGEGEVLNLEASSPIYGIKWLSSIKDGPISVSFCKNNIICDMDEDCNFEKFLSIYVDFYEGRFNPPSDDYSELYEIDEEGNPL